MKDKTYYVYLGSGKPGTIALIDAGIDSSSQQMIVPYADVVELFKKFISLHKIKYMGKLGYEKYYCFLRIQFRP
ncbi:hypothetical protein SAMN04488055_3131 [Chitinophaga niabensis]|uniref:Uncharacterized protein n=1 Tax=Chitinophaga niabensis TaxID=536979 RepID=A0A1N6H242_9BACT|nr:hypothetical protein SAMN04488055_3131 [Chitinophaga niabensis]